MEPTPEDIARATAQPPAVVERRKSSRPAEFHRLLPQSDEAEKGLLSSIMNAPESVILLCYQRHVTREWFHIPSNQTMFDLLMEMADAGQFPDPIVCTQMLRDRRLLDSLGGPTFPTDILTYVSTGAHAGHYIEILEKKRTRREIIRVGTESVERAYDEGDDETELLDDIESKVLDIARHRARGSDQVSGKAASEEAMKNIRWRIANKGKIRGLSTGFKRLDERTDGLHRQELIIVASRPSEGKTTLCMQIAEHIAFDLRKSVAFFSLEMSREQFLERWIYMRARVNSGQVRIDGATPAMEKDLETAAAELAGAPIVIEDSEGMTIQQFRASARRLVRERKVEAIFVDSGSAMKSSSRQAQMKHEREIADITAGLKSAAKELNVPIVALWHLGRQQDGKEGQDPQLSALRGGATVEQDADVVMMLLPEWEPGECHPVQIYLPKQRCAERHARCDMFFWKGLTLFAEAEEVNVQQGLGI